MTLLRFGLLALAMPALTAPALADAPHGFLETVRRHTTLTSTVTDNGDLNPYAVVVAPVSAGRVMKDDVLVDNFNNLSNLQGTGTTIVGYRPSTGATYMLARLPQTIPDCPGGVGLTTAMVMLKSGWIIVGSTPSRDGTTATKGAGLPDRPRPVGQAGDELGGTPDQRSLGRHGRAGPRRHRDAVCQHGGFRPAGADRDRPRAQDYTPDRKSVV